jgi:hypothetical protein
MTIDFRFRHWFHLSVAFALLVAASFAQGQQPQINTAVDASQRKVIGNSVHPLAARANDLGRADGGTSMKDMLLMLHPSDAQAATLKKYVDDLHNPSSKSFHKWLTPDQYAARFGAADADVKTVSDWLASNGFSVDKVARGKNWIRFSGTSSQVESAFQTSVHKYAVNGETKYANATSLSIPAALAPAVSGVVRVNNFLSQPQHVAPDKITRDKNGKLVRVSGAGTAQTLSGSASKTASPAFTYNGDQVETYLTPGDFSKIYDAQSVVASGVDGTGVSIAIVGRSDIAMSDVEAFRTISGLPFNDPNIVYATTDPGVVPGDDVEASLDVEWAGAIAPRATINYVIGASTNTTDGVDVAASHIVDGAISPIMTVSFGLCEADMSDTQVAFYQLLWEQAASEGITVFVSSGDAGSSGCNAPSNASTVYGFGVSGLASTAYNTAVGGTEFNEADLTTYWSLNNATDQSSVKGYIPEAVWNESCAGKVTPGLTNCNFPPYYLDSYAGGGGASSCISRMTDDSGIEYCSAGYPKPSWQSGPGVPTDGVRDIPDVSLAAASEHDGYIYCYQGGCQWTTNSDGSITLENAGVIGGTSAASPSMASIMALVEQKHGQFQGVANYKLYNLAAKQTASCDASKRTDPAQGTSCVFNDITTGSNAVPCFSGNQDCQGQDQPVQVGVSRPPAIFPPDSFTDGQSATTGYDLGSGLGSVDVANLVAAWGNSTTTGSATTLAVSKTTFQHGTSIMLSGQVTPASGSSVPTGDVLIMAISKDASIPVVSMTLASGAYSGSSINLPGGTYTLVAKYMGDANFGASSSAPVSVTVSKEASTLTGTSFGYSRFYILGRRPIVQLNNTPLGNSFWLQFQVSGASGSIAATGAIKLSQGGKVFGTYPVSNTGLIYVQCGPLTECDFAPGAYNFQAAYSGDSGFVGTTKTLKFTVDQGTAYWETAASNTTPVSNTRTIGYVYFDTDPAIPPTGSVTLIRDDTGAVLGTAKIDSTGTATIPFSPAPGAFNLIATYAGDTNYKAGGQKVTQEIITEDNAGTKKIKLTLNLSGTSFTLGQQTQYSVSVASATTGSTSSPIGYVTLYSGYGQIAGTLSLSGGKATGTVAWDAVGTQSVYAVYGGDGNYGSGNSAATTVTVAQATPTVTVQPLASYVAVGGQTSLTALLSSPLSTSNVQAPTGSIVFFDSVNGHAATQIGRAQALANGNGGTILATIAPVLAAGSNVITAVYSGDVNWKSTTSAATTPILVTAPGFTETATPNPLTLTAGQTASLTVTTQSILSFSSQIALSCGGTLPEGVTCNSTTTAPGGSATLSLTATAPGTTSTNTSLAHNAPWLMFSGTVTMAGLFLICIPNRRRFAHLSMILLALALVGGVVGCGGGSGAKPTTLVLTSSNSKVASGASVNLQAIVQSANPNNLKGVITFYDGSTAIGSPTAPTNGVATLATSSLSVGTHAITAKFAGDSHDTASASSDVLDQTVTGGFTLTVNATSGTLSQSISVPATLQ